MDYTTSGYLNFRGANIVFVAHGRRDKSMETTKAGTNYYGAVCWRVTDRRINGADT